MDAAQRWERIKRLLDEVLDAPADQRWTRLRQVVREDPTLGPEVEALLEGEEQADGFLEKPLFERSVEEDLAPGSRLGPYEVVRLLGHGGMGEVYLARRVDDFERQVALKVIRHGLRRRDLVRRFENERQILARIEHPYIARLLDGGTTVEGLPYLVMEYVDGEPLDVYVERNGLSIRERVGLFRGICSAFEELHRNLIVHRDLKPGNVLITRTGEPRLLDFGVAKLLQPTLFGRLLDTQVGLRPLTPVYASPEQIRNEPITTSSDIYSLGVLLFELLTGELPYRADPQDLAALFHEICEVDPEKPSSTVRRRAAEPDLDPTEADQARRSVSEISGDLDSIVLKSLRKRPEQRYGSVEQLSEDLRRFLTGLPVLARQGSALYHFGKLVRRRKLPAAALVLIALLTASSLTLWRRAVHERDLAIRERQHAEEVALFLEDMFRQAKPDSSQGHEVTLREALDRARAGLADLQVGPGLRAGLVATLADVYRDLGAYKESRELFSEAVLLRQQDPDNDPALLAKELSNLGGVEYYLGELNDAEGHLRSALTLRQQLGQSGDDVVVTQNNLASILTFRGAFREAEDLYTEGLEIRQRLHGPGSTEVASSLYNLGSLAFFRGDLGKAEGLLRRSLTSRERVLGPDHTQVAAVLNTLGRTLHARGDLKGAESYFRRALTIRLERLGEDHPDVAASKRDLAALLLDRGELAAVEPLLTEALAVQREHTPEGEFWIATVQSVLGAYYAARGRSQEAEPLLLHSYRTILENRGPQCTYTRQAAERLFRFYQNRGEFSRAAEIRKALEGDEGPLKKGGEVGRPTSP